MKYSEFKKAIKNVKDQIYYIYTGEKRIENYSGCWNYNEIITHVKLPELLNNPRGYVFCEKEIDSYRF